MAKRRKRSRFEFGGELEGLLVRRPTLEEVYLSLTEEAEAP